MKLKPSDLNQRIQFGVSKDNLDTSGNFYEHQFVVQFTLWGAPHTRTLNQQYQIANIGLEDTIVVAIRHNKNVNDSYLVRYRSEMYHIVAISPDDSNQTFAYDLVTLRKVEKAGSAS